MPRRPLIDLLERRDPPIDDPAAALVEFRVKVDGVVLTNPRVAGRLGGADRRHAPARAAGRASSYALDASGLDVSDAVAVDLGACTGGFTLALLRRAWPGCSPSTSVTVSFSARSARTPAGEPRTHERRRRDPPVVGTHPSLIVVDVTRTKLREIAQQIADNGVPAPGTPCSSGW